jgi:hypothetical protein
VFESSHPCWHNREKYGVKKTIILKLKLKFVCENTCDSFTYLGNLGKCITN